MADRHRRRPSVGVGVGTRPTGVPTRPSVERTRNVPAGHAARCPGVARDSRRGDCCLRCVARACLYNAGCCVQPVSAAGRTCAYSVRGKIQLALTTCVAGGAPLESCVVPSVTTCEIL